METPWWRHAVCYQIYVRSFADGDGDGIGDLAGIASRLDHLVRLGVDAVWLTPFYRSPQHDHGYDVADPFAVDPLFGDLAAFDALVEQAHRTGLKVLVDVVPNHVSVDHEWFRAALAAGPGSPERDRFHFRPGTAPFNNWNAMFGGPAWTQVEDGEWYLHLFDSTQPDLNWENPDVPAYFEQVLRFWLDRGVDGFRIDVAHALHKVPGLPDEIPGDPDQPQWDRPEVHDVHRSWRRVLDSYDGDRMAVGEAWVFDADALARYLRPDELHQAFNFHWLGTPWSADAFAATIRDSLAALGGGATWVLSNHDVVRHVTRYGDGPAGSARARAATMAMLALPGSAYLYQGEELGLPEVEVAPEHWQDPLAVRTGNPGRDGCRVPLPWSGEAPPYGFGPGSGQPWIPQPTDWAGLSVSAQEADPQSTLAFYRQMLDVRRSFAATAGDHVEVSAEGDVLQMRRGPVRCLVNCGSVPVAVGAGTTLLASSPVVDGLLVPDAAVWLRD